RPLGEGPVGVELPPERVKWYRAAAASSTTTRAMAMTALFESSEDRGDGLAAPDASAEDAPSAGRDLLNEGSLKNERDALAGAGGPTGRGGLTGPALLVDGRWCGLALGACG